MEQALCAAPSAPGITVADLEVVRECAGLAGASEALRSGNFLAERYHDEHAPALARGGDDEWIENGRSKTLRRTRFRRNRRSSLRALATVTSEAVTETDATRACRRGLRLHLPWRCIRTPRARGALGEGTARSPGDLRAVIARRSSPVRFLIREAGRVLATARTPSKRSRRLNLPVRRSGRREMSIWTRSSDFCSRRWEMGSGWRLKARLA